MRNFTQPQPLRKTFTVSKPPVSQPPVEIAAEDAIKRTTAVEAELKEPELKWLSSQDKVKTDEDNINDTQKDNHSESESGVTFTDSDFSSALDVKKTTTKPTQKAMTY